MKLKEQVAVVTGGGRGIGKAICHAFAAEGAKIVVAADVEAEVEATTQSIQESGGDAIGITTDITRQEDVIRMSEKIADRFGRVDILVNNAGVVGKRLFLHDADDADWRRTMEINIFGVYYCTKALLPMILKRRKGRIINIASIYGKQGSPTNSAYSASKHAVIGITKSLAMEMGMLKVPGITVNAVCPGIANTDMLTGKGTLLDEAAEILGKTREAVLEERIKPMSVQHRILEPGEIAEMALFLASDAGAGITGQAINVCAGSIFH